MTRGSDASSLKRCACADSRKKTTTDVNIVIFTCVYTIFARLLIFTSMFYEPVLVVLFQSNEIYNPYCQLNFNSVLCAFIHSASFFIITYNSCKNIYLLLATQQNNLLINRFKPILIQRFKLHVKY